jgi:RimJ/RimL family protein N-acetyltransferase
MRSATLHLAFAGLNARETTSEAFLDNDASNAVSRSLDYEPDGLNWAARRGHPAQLCRWRMDRSRWQGTRRPDIALSGVEECLPVLALKPAR